MFSACAVQRCKILLVQQTSVWRKNLLHGMSEERAGIVGVAYSGDIFG
jgi:hypothetical protein